MSEQATHAESAADVAVRSIRQMITNGELTAGMKISEERMAQRLSISRNTLREALRILVSAGLLQRAHNRGVTVTELDAEAIVDIFSARHLIECSSLRLSNPYHPAIQAMEDAVTEAEAARECEDWGAVGTANMKFHRAIVDFSNSKRLASVMDGLIAELRIAFSNSSDARLLHAPYVDQNRKIVNLTKTNRVEEAVNLLESYFTQSERNLIMEQQRTLKASAAS